LERQSGKSVFQPVAAASPRTISRFRSTTMAKDAHPAEELNAFAQQAKDQALAAADTYFDFLKKALSAYPSSGNVFGDSVKSYAEKNISVMQDYVHKLGRAKDFQEALRVQAEFMQSQFAAMGEQTKNLGETYQRSAADVMNKTVKL
jgi:hypothetical protein